MWQFEIFNLGSKFQRINTNKEECRIFQFLCLLLVDMITFWICLVKKKLLKLTSPISFSFFNVFTRKLKLYMWFALLFYWTARI